MRNCLLLIATVLCQLMIGYVTVSAEPANDRLIQRLVEQQRKRDQEFGNMHAVWREERLDEGGTLQSSKIEYWSRDDTYFRFDITTLSDSTVGGETIEHTTRFIVRPEGFAKLSAQPATKEFAVIDFGSSDTGKATVQGQLWYCALNKDMPYRQVFENIVDWSREKLDFRYMIESLADGTMVATSIYGEKGNSSKCVSVMSKDDYRVTSATSNDNVTGRPALSIIRTNDYGTFHSLPLTTFQEENWSSGEKESVRYRLVEVNFEAASIDVFNIEDFTPSIDRGSTNHWVRRFATFMIGIALLSIYFHHRSKRRVRT